MKLRSLLRWAIWATSLTGTLGCDRAREGAAPGEYEYTLFPTGAVPPCDQQARGNVLVALPGTVVLDDTTYPCRLSFRHTGIILQGAWAGGTPYPGRSVARDSRGRFITSIAGDNSRIAIWRADGSFDRTIGSPGQGPGELPASQVEPFVYVDEDDWIYVRSGGHLMTVFREGGEYRGRAYVPGTGLSEANAVFRGGRILVTGGYDYHFRLHGPDGRLISAFNSVTAEQRASVFFRYVVRNVLAVDDTSFWAGPETADEGYALDLWSTDGKRLITVRRTVSWFEEGLSYGRSGRGQWRGPKLAPVHVDTAGVLLVYTLVRGEGGANNMHLEALDWRSGQTLASEIIAFDEFRNRVPRFFFPRTNLAYVYDNSADEPVIRIVEYRLTQP